MVRIVTVTSMKEILTNDRKRLSVYRNQLLSVYRKLIFVKFETT